MTQDFYPLAVYSPEAHLSIEAHLGDIEFACDLSVCKGACCTMPGGRGAPILKPEIAELERVFPIVKNIFPKPYCGQSKSMVCGRSKWTEPSQSRQSIGKNVFL